MRIRWRGLELPSRVSRDEAVSSDTYGKFSAEPFERGFGTTVGNSLRRILLSSLEGAAVTHIKLKGAEHEFSSLRGVMEDVTDIILNVKSLIVKLDADEPKEMRLTRKKPGPITAGMIEADPSITIVNKDLVIATLTEDVTFDMTLTVDKGRGYVTAAENIEDVEEQEIGTDRGRQQLLAGHPRPLRDRGRPRRAEDRLRPADPGDLDQRHDLAGDGDGGGEQDPPQAPQPVRAVLRAGQRPGQRGRRRRACATRTRR